MEFVKIALIILLLYVPASAYTDDETEENYAPIFFLKDWKRGGVSMWYAIIQVEDDEFSALAEIRLFGELIITYRIEYPCIDDNDNLIPQQFEVVAWKRGERIGTHTLCSGDTDSNHPISPVAERMLGVPPEFFMWGIVHVGR